MAVFGSYIHKKMLNKVSGLRDAELGVDICKFDVKPLNSWNRFETKQC